MDWSRLSLLGPTLSLAQRLRFSGLHTSDVKTLCGPTMEKTGGAGQQRGTTARLSLPALISYWTHEDMTPT